MANLKRARHPQVQHFVYFVGEQPPPWWVDFTVGLNVHTMVDADPPGKSIGHYHNLGARAADTEWIMKLDADAVPNELYFERLLPVLFQAPPGGWFNGGMIYLNEAVSAHLDSFPDGIGAYAYDQIMKHHTAGAKLDFHASPYRLPAATNFICRRMDYLGLGGCDERFQGYGWEDYQQIYMLEKFRLGEDPLPGWIDLGNVTNRCRDEISRPRAFELWECQPELCLLHHWHPKSHKDHRQMDKNKRILLDYILRSRGNAV